MKIGLFLKEKKLQLIFLVYVILLIPFVSLMAQNSTVSVLVLGITVSVILLVAILLLSSFMSTKMLRVIYSVLFLLALVPGGVLLGYLLFAKVLLSEGSIMALFETNPNESKEFVAAYLNPWVILGVVLYVLLPLVMIFKIKNDSNYRVREHKNVFVACIALLLLFLTSEPVAQHIYFIDFYRIYADYRIRTKMEQKAIARRQSEAFDLIVKEKKAPQTLVVVIGESLSRYHMGLYGYERHTNPLLSKRQNELIVYHDAVSPQVHTIPAIRSILTFADDANPHYLTARPSLLELFNRAGFETYYLTNQPFEEANSSYEPLFGLANNIIDVSKGSHPDGVVLEQLRQVLELDKRKLVVVHLMGCHTAYRFRYPSSFDHFDHQKHPIPFVSNHLNLQAKTTVDQYDNAVLYNDFLIDSVLCLLEQKSESAAMVYFSDHGEEVFEFRDFAGHAYEKVSTYMCEVPFVVWLSHDFRKKRKDLVFKPTYSFCTTDFLYSLSDLAGISYEGYDDTRSIFSESFLYRDRKVGHFLYEDIAKATKIEGLRLAAKRH